MEIILTALDTPDENAKKYKNEIQKTRIDTGLNAIHSRIKWDFPETPYDDIVKAFRGRPKKWKEFLRRFFIYRDKYGVFCTREPGFSNIFIAPTSSKMLRQLIGTAPTISETNDFFVSINLMAIVDCRHSHKDKIARKYVWNWDVADKVADFAKNNGIGFETTPVKPEIYDYYASKDIGIKSGMNLPKKGNVRDTYLAIEKIILERNPVLGTLWDNISGINDYAGKMKCIEGMTRANLNINFSKKDRITSISLRAYSAICSAKKELPERIPTMIFDIETGKMQPNFAQTPLWELEDDNFEHKKYRAEIMGKYDLNYENDVSGSILRLTRSIYAGEYDTKTESYYDEILKAAHEELKYRVSNDLIQGDPEQYDLAQLKDIMQQYAVRGFGTDGKLYKKLFMRGYFAPSSKYMTAKILNYADTDALGFTPLDKKELSEFADIYFTAIRKTLGGSFGSKIFLAESALMTTVQRKLLEEGNPTLLIYDAIVTKYEVKDLDRRLKEAFDELKSALKVTFEEFGTKPFKNNQNIVDIRQRYFVSNEENVPLRSTFSHSKDFDEIFSNLNIDSQIDSEKTFKTLKNTESKAAKHKAAKNTKDNDIEIDISLSKSLENSKESVCCESQNSKIVKEFCDKMINQNDERYEYG